MKYCNIKFDQMKELFIKFYKKMIQDIINEELKVFILNLKRNNQKIKIIYNGYVKRKISTLFGYITIKVPRLRNYKFTPNIIKESISEDILHNLCVNLYGHGNSTRRISSIISEVFNVNLSKSTISNLCKVLDSDVYEYFAQDISKYNFKVIQIDGKYFRVDSVNKYRKSVLLSAIGITDCGRRIHIHMKVVANENYVGISSFIKELKNRINQEIECFVVDGNQDLSKVIKEEFPSSNIQLCLVHIVRLIKIKLKDIASVQDRRNIETELNSIFFDSKPEEIKDKIREFLVKWSKYSYVLQKVLNNDNIWIYTSLSTFNDCKTNNIIEGIHSQLDMVTINHKSYSDENSLYRAVISEIKRYNTLESTCSEITTNIEGIELKKIMNISQLVDNIIIKVFYNGKCALKGEIDKEQYKSIRKIFNTS